MWVRQKLVSLAAMFLFVTCIAVWRNLPGSYERGRRDKRPAVRSNSTKIVLVTGAAGFIGFHLAKKLAEEKHIVVGIDNFNDYYDVGLKKDRAFMLHEMGVKIYHEDLCHTEFLEDLFTIYNFTHVTHLAAQAGVRYSLENPLAYIRANVECQVALLEVLRKHPHIKLVYASSSSVYGKHTPVPFRLTARTDRPGNMYAATKETDELLGKYYCEAYQMSAVGLRFFTVYGPWGRPDMATYKFAEAMVTGNEVPMFFISDDKPLERDFTYVDDIIKGITATMDYVPAECGEKFNLGFGQPLSVPQLINILQKELGVKGHIKKKPLPPTEILKTWADTSVSQELLHFHPTTDLNLGTKKFVKWFTDYKKECKNRDRYSLEPRNKWFDQIIKERDNRDERYENKKMLKHNEALQARLSHERQRYAEWAHTKGLHVPVICDVKFIVDSANGGFRQTCPCKPGYQSLGRDCIPLYNELNIALVEQEFKKEAQVISELKKGKKIVMYMGESVQGGDYMYAPGKSLEELRQICIADRLCLAVSTDGWMKRQLTSRETWKKSLKGLIIFDVDYCSHSEIKCPSNSRCTKLGLANYQCVCDPPLAMDRRQHRCDTAPKGFKPPKLENIFEQYDKKAGYMKAKTNSKYNVEIGDMKAKTNSKYNVEIGDMKAKTNSKDNVAADDKKAKTDSKDSVAADDKKAKTDGKDNIAIDDKKAKTDSKDNVAADDKKAKTDSKDNVAADDKKAKTDSKDNVAADDKKAKTDSKDNVAADDKKAKTDSKDKVVADNQKAKNDNVPSVTPKIPSKKS